MNEQLKYFIDSAVYPQNQKVIRAYRMDDEIEAVKYIGDRMIGNFEINDINTGTIKALIKHFNDGSDKGVFLRGDIGSGKTLMMTLFQKYCGVILRTGFRIAHVRELVTKFNEDGHKGLSQFLYADEIQCGAIVRKAHRLCIDDIGTESNSIRFYGTQINLVEEFIEARYDIWKSTGVVTHFTTNMTPSLLKDSYGERVYSRLVEMVQDIVLPGKDRRRVNAKHS